MTPEELGNLLIGLAVAMAVLTFACLHVANSIRQASTRLSKSIDTHTLAITTEANKNAEWQG